MNLTIPRAPLLSALRFCAHVADARSTMPILSHLALRVDGSTLTVAGTDLNRAAIATCEVTKGAGGTLVLPAKKLVDMVAGLPDGDVTIAADKSHGTIKSKRVAYQLAGLSPRDLPKLPDTDLDTVPIVGSVLMALIDRVDDAILNDETRFHLNGAKLEADGKTWRLVTTDGHRLAVCERDALPLKMPGDGVIVPQLAVANLRALAADAGDDELAVGVKWPWLVAKHGARTLVVKLIDAQFPPWRQVVPGRAAQTITVNRAELHDAVKRCALMSSDTRGVRLGIVEGGIRLEADDPDAGSVREEIEARGHKSDLTIGAAPKYLLQALAAYATDEVTVEVNGALDPMIIRPVGADAAFSVVMPMRL